MIDVHIIHYMYLYMELILYERNKAVQWGQPSSNRCDVPLKPLTKRAVVNATWLFHDLGVLAGYKSLHEFILFSYAMVVLPLTTKMLSPLQKESNTTFLDVGEIIVVCQHVKWSHFGSNNIAYLNYEVYLTGCLLAKPLISSYDWGEFISPHLHSK